MKTITTTIKRTAGGLLCLLALLLIGAEGHTLATAALLLAALWAGSRLVSSTIPDSDDER